MELLKCIIVDDDHMARMVIEQLCTQTGTVEILGSFVCATDAYRFLSTNTIDVVFLDIEMPDMSGIDLLKSMPNKPRVIFITGKKEHAIEAFDLEVIDYLVKPIQYPRFLKALRKVSDIIQKSETTEANHIFIKSEGIFHKIDLEDLVYIEAQGDYISVHTSKKRITIYETLKKIEEKLNSAFLRVHRSYIINKDFITSIEDNCISLSGGELIPIGVSYKTQVSKALHLN
jgi:DNA-binding LytR/AlgR family response regulator